MSREQVLSLLLQQENQYLSGAAMSRALGVSRAAVWKAIEALRQEDILFSPRPTAGIGWTAPPTGCGRGAGRAPGRMPCGQ